MPEPTRDPSASRKLRRAWPVLPLALVFALALVSDAALSGWATGAPAGLLTVGLFVTSFGSSDYMFAFSAGLVFCSFVALGRGRRMWNGGSARLVAERSIFFLASIAVSGLLAQSIKHLVGRVRPRLRLPDGVFSFHPLSLPDVFASFPSGHTTSAFAAAVALGAIAPKWRPWLLVFATMIGSSRVLVGAHYPSDVVAGAALGTMTSLALARGFARRRVAFVPRGDRVLAKTTPPRDPPVRRRG